MYTFLRIVLLIWMIGFLVISCGPLMTGNTTLGGIGLITGVFLFIPWLAGVVILASLVWFTNPRR
jgi:hypothetical protein